MVEEMKIRNKILDPWTIYNYFKFGFISVAFLVSPLNLIILSYNFLFIKDFISMPIYVILFFSISSPIAVVLGVYSWKKGEHKKTMDLSIKHNHFIGAQARAWIKFVDGDYEGSKKEMLPYLKCGVNSGVTHQ
jgi:hypothetical protein